MKAGTMEGLIGANTSMKMVDTPMRVYKEAERKGDTSTMERAMGYAEEFTQKSYEYKDQAEEELRKEMKEEKKEQKIQQEERIEKHREEIKEQNGEVTEPTEDNKDTVAISEEGQKWSNENNKIADASIESGSTESKVYTSKGTVVEVEISEAEISLSV